MQKPGWFTAQPRFLWIYMILTKPAAAILWVYTVIASESRFRVPGLFGIFQKVWCKFSASRISGRD
jgi:hypothetical protein